MIRFTSFRATTKACISWFLAALALCSTVRPPKPALATETEEMRAFPAMTELARIAVAGERPTVGDWQDIRSVVGKKTFNALVIATWCKYSSNYLKKLNKRAGMNPFDMIVVLDNELEVGLELAVKKNEMAQSEADAILESSKNSGRLLAVPEELGNYPKFSKMFYLVRGRKLKNVSIPSFIQCDSQRCQQGSIRNVARSKNLSAEPRFACKKVLVTEELDLRGNTVSSTPLQCYIECPRKEKKPLELDQCADLDRN